MKSAIFLAYTVMCAGLLSCQPDSNNPRPDPKKQTPENTAPKTDTAPTNPAAPLPGDKSTATAPPGTPPGSASTAAGATCKDTELPIPTGVKEKFYRDCCFKLHPDRACHTSKYCWIKGEISLIEKAFKSGNCTKPPASASLQLNEDSSPQ